MDLPGIHTGEAGGGGGGKGGGGSHGAKLARLLSTEM